jgi:hypothetical protein
MCSFSEIPAQICASLLRCEQIYFLKRVLADVPYPKVAVRAVK